MKRFSLIVVGCSTLCVISMLGWAAGTGVVQGTVLDENGKPLFGAKVKADRTDGGPRSSAIRYEETGRDGRFVIDRLDWGSYRVDAMKADEGYPDTSFAFYSNGPLPEVKLNPQTPSAEVLLKMGPKAATLHVASVTDGTSGKNLMTLAGIGLWRTGIPTTFLATSASIERILIPSSTDVTFDIQAEGYERWPSQPTMGQIRLAPGQTFDLRVQLQPLPGIDSEIARMVRRAADANRLVWTGKKVTGPLPPPSEDIQRLQQLAAEGRSALAQYLQPGKDPLDQIGAISLLANIGGDQSLDMIDEFAERAQDPLVRTEALKRLATSKRPKDLALLQQTSTADPDPKVRDTALKLLERLKPNN